MKLNQFTSRLSDGMDAAGRYRMRHVYDSVIQSINRFCDGNSPTLRTVYTKTFLRQYQEYLTLRGCKRNTISFYMTALRSIFSAAVKTGVLHSAPDLFTDVFTGTDPTGKRALEPDTLAVLLTADLSEVPRLERCRDLFVLSLLLQGMPFVDLVHMRKSDIQGNVLTYRRRKTGGLVSVSILESARVLLDKFAEESEGSSYVLPLITLAGANGYRQYQTVLRRHNRQLKELALYLGIADTLTSYVARHSWATLAHHNGVDVGIVSQGMGHHTETITRVYLSSFEQSKLTEANRVVLRAILRPIEEGRVKSALNTKSLAGLEEDAMINDPGRWESLFEPEYPLSKKCKENRYTPKGAKNVRHLRHDRRYNEKG